MRIEKRYWIIGASALIAVTGIAFVAMKLGFQGYDSQLDIYVSPNGNDANAGTIDSPFATLTKAQTTVRSAKGAVSQPGPINVWLRGGNYTLDSSLSLTNSDSGTTTNPIVYRSYQGERALIGAGQSLTGFSDVTDQTVLNRLNASAKENVKKLDLASLGITNLGTIQKWGGWRRKLHRCSRNNVRTLFQRSTHDNGPLAQQPNRSIYGKC